MLLCCDVVSLGVLFYCVISCVLCSVLYVVRCECCGASLWYWCVLCYCVSVVLCCYCLIALVLYCVMVVVFGCVVIVVLCNCFSTGVLHVMLCMYGVLLS